MYCELTVSYILNKFTGKLRTSLVNGMEFMPFDTENKSDQCFIPAEDRPKYQCFVGGMV